MAWTPVSTSLVGGVGRSASVPSPNPKCAGTSARSGQLKARKWLRPIWSIAIRISDSPMRLRGLRRRLLAVLILVGCGSTKSGGAASDSGGIAKDQFVA